MKNEVFAYVDGSFNSSYGVYGCGVVISNNGQIHEKNYATYNEDFAKLRNIAGECEASKYAMYYALTNNIPEITIYHDYVGVGAWCTGKWKANPDYTQEYRAFYQKVSQKVKVNFVKVKGHSGVELNERADKLAKDAISDFIIQITNA